MSAVEILFIDLDACRLGIPLFPQDGKRFGIAGTEGRNLIAQRTEDALAVAVDIVDHEKALSEPLRVHPLLHHLERCLLLADDQSGLTAPDDVGQDVDDRLALAGSGRSLDEETGRQP